MKIVVFGPGKRTGMLRDGEIVDISRACAKFLHERENEPNAAVLAEALAPSDLGRFIEGGRRALDNAAKALDHLYSSGERTGPNGETLIFGADAVRLHAPRARGGRVACAGGNFADHAAAMQQRAAERGEDRQAFKGDPREAVRSRGIWGFWKVDRESAGQDGRLAYPARAQWLDYEGEVAIVLGKAGKNVRAAEVKDYVWGVTLLGDWSIRMSAEPGPLKFAMQKNFDGSCSIGPCIAVDEADPFDVDIETLVNGERRQHYNTKDMVYSFGDYLESLSRDFTFYPGDMISGGTAAGTAADSSPILDGGKPSPDRFLKPGDSVEITSPQIGSLRTTVVESNA